MKFVVPLMMPMTRRMRSPARDSFSGLMMGIPPATAASKARSTPVCSASSKSSLPRVASNSLLAVTTERPEARALRMRLRAGSMPPMTSTTILTSGSSTTSLGSLVNRSLGTGTSRSFARFLTATRLTVRWAPDRSVPVPGPGEVRVRVTHCGVCRTDLHLAEGDLPPHRPNTVPGHEVVGTVDTLGPGSSRFEMGARVGIAWLRWTDGTCRFCTRGKENLCLSPAFTGWDADGGYAEYATVPEAFAYALPSGLPGDQLAPFLCAGIIGYRALRLAELPPGGRLGIYGFGGSAHLIAQVALSEGARLHVMTRGAEARELALSLGAASASG